MSQGANCTNENGLAVQHLRTKTGYWRFNSTTVKYHYCDKIKEQEEGEDNNRCCPDDQCANITNMSDPNEQCRKGYKGPLCLGCAPDYVKRIRGNDIWCEPCEGHEKDGFTSAVTVLVVFTALIFLGSVVYFLQVKPPKMDSLLDDKQRRLSVQEATNAQGRVVSDQILIGRVAGSMHRSGSNFIKSDFQLAADRFKVVFGWMQIFASDCDLWEC